MLNEFDGIGNVGLAPSLQITNIEDAQHSVAHLRVYFDRPIRQDDLSYQDKGGFWLTVSCWDKRAEQAMRILKSGARVFMKGQLREHQWTDKETGEVRSELQLTADYFFIDPLCIESIQYQFRSRQSNSEQTNSEPVPTGYQANQTERV
jgi:single-strand DNA-binding protein